MYLLESSDYPAIAQLAEKMSHCVAVGAVVRGISPARVYVDDKSSPRTALIWTRRGYHYLLGEPKGRDVAHGLAELISDELAPLSASQGVATPILYPCVPEWGEHVGTILRRWDHVREFRQLFVFYKDEFRDVGSWSGRMYPRFALKRLDAESISSLGGEIEQAVLDAWGSTDQFAKHGFGYYILESDKLASYCISTAFDGHSVEVYVRTIPEYRRKGLGTAVCSAFIRQCLSNGLTPSWECSWTNSAASSLARRVAFRSVKNVPVYKFHVY